MNRILILPVCVVAALAGLIGGRALRLGGIERLAAAGNVSSRGDSPRHSPKSEQRETSHTARVKSNLGHATGARHWLHWMAGVESASLADLPGLARLAKDNPGALRMIAYRWIELDPAHLFETLRREGRSFDARGEAHFPVGELARYLFNEWPRRDMAAAVAALSGPDPLAGLGGLRHTVLNVAAKSDPKLGLELMERWSIHNYGPDTSGVAEWARRDPAAAAQAALDHPVGYGAESCLKAIANVWAESDPEAAMAFALATSSSLSGTMREAVLAAWAGRDLDAASDWLARQDDDAVRTLLSPVLIEAWAKDDPEGALAWCQENLEGHRLITAVAKLAKGAAVTDVRAAAGMVAGMDASPARTQAAVAVAQAWFPQSWPSGQPIAPEAVAWLRNLGDAELQGAILEKVAWGWAAQDRDGLIEFLSGAQGTRASSSVYRTVMHSLARDDPQRAMEWAATLSNERVAEASEAGFSIWTQHQPAAAMAWLQELPATDPRRPMLVTSFIQSALWQPEPIAAQRLAVLPGSDRATARAAIRRADLPDEKKAALQRALGE